MNGIGRYFVPERCNVANYCEDVGLIPGGGPIVDEFFSTVPGLNFDMRLHDFRANVTA